MPAQLDSLAVRRYRCFADEFRLTFAPVTLLYGWNNAGKSAALRLVGLLHDSLQPDAAVPFVTTGPAGRDCSFRDLEWKGSGENEEPGFALELEWSGGAIMSARYQLDYSREREEPYVRRLSIHPSGRESLEFQSLIDPKGDPSARDISEVEFVGLVPRSSSDATSMVVRGLETQLTDLRGALQWLGVNRGELPRDVPRERPAPSVIAPNGGGTVELLVRDPKLLRAVGRWYASEHIRRQLRVREDSVLRGLSLGGLDGPSAAFEIPLADTGAGMSQVLPVLTSAILAAQRAELGRPAVLSVEEPESQLHGNAIRALVDWLCEIANDDLPPSLVLETHSRPLLVAFQLAVAEGKLRSDRFQVYWLSQRDDGASLAHVAKLDENGTYRSDSPLPSSAFAHEDELNDLYLQHILDGTHSDAGSVD